MVTKSTMLVCNPTPKKRKDILFSKIERLKKKLERKKRLGKKEISKIEKAIEIALLLVD